MLKEIILLGKETERQEVTKIVQLPSTLRGLREHDGFNLWAVWEAHLAAHRERLFSVLPQKELKTATIVNRLESWVFPGSSSDTVDLSAGSSL